MKKFIYKIRFERFNSYTSPMLEQKSDVVFRSDVDVPNDGDWRGQVSIDKANELETIMYKEMWNQNPHWLLSHGPSTIGFKGWSSVMVEFDTLRKIEHNDESSREDMTGDGNMAVPMTFHPALPDDLRASLQSAYDRGVKDTKNKA